MESNKKRWIPSMIIGTLLLFWEILVRVKQIPLYVLPAPVKVLEALWRERAVLLGHTGITVLEALLGMALALVFALFLGVAMDMFPPVKKGIYPLLVVTQTVPMIVLAPILIIYLGFGMMPKILTVVLMCFFPIAVSFTDGMGQADQGYTNLVKSYGASPWEVYTLVKIPSALPSLVSGLKVAATYSISGAVVGEWIASQSGLGYYLLRVKNSYMLDKVFACVFVIILLSLCMNGVIKAYQYFCLPYMRKEKAGHEKRRKKDEKINDRFSCRGHGGGADRVSGKRPQGEGRTDGAGGSGQPGGLRGE